MILEQEQNLGKRLVDLGGISTTQLSEAMQASEQKGISFSAYLVHSGMAPKVLVYETLAEMFSVPFVDIPNFHISQDVIPLLPSDLAHRYRAIPLFKIGNTLNVALENPGELGAIDHLSRACSCDIDVCLGATQDIQNALQEYYGVSSSINELLDSLNKERTHRLKTEDQKNRQQQKALGKITLSVKSTGERPVIQLVDLMFQQAYEKGASDIHVEPEEKVLRIRYRIDGVLHEAATPLKEMEAEIISRIKIMSQMDIAETRLPQDGRIKLMVNEKSVDMRVSTMPTVNGENIVIRLLREDHGVLDLSSLGFNAEMRKQFELMIRRPYGMILETGPTGSGKTTSLYAALSLINSLERNIMTIEDPVEYKLPILRQIAVNTKAGLTFATALRSILRQDPDVIMVGEIRDKETAEIAVQAALTGHLVFSTLHTNTAASAITRLADMGIEPFLISSSMIGVVAQRLIRRICEKCREETKPSEALLQIWGITDPNFKCYVGKGCRQCNQTGYKGRVGIFELLKIDEHIQKQIIKTSSASEIQNEAKKHGFNSLRDDALAKVRAGQTTLEEVLKSIDLG